MIIRHIGAFGPGSDSPPRRWRFIFAWYDLWVGVFWDRTKRKLYILPLPCIGIVIDCAKRETQT